MKPRGPRIRAGQKWFVVLPCADACWCVHLEEVTRKTVVLRGEEDLGIKIELLSRYPRVDVRFVERVP